MFYLNIFKQDGSALFESEPQGDVSIPVIVDERAARTLAAMDALASFEWSHACAQLVQAGIAIRQREECCR